MMKVFPLNSSFKFFSYGFVPLFLLVLTFNSSCDRLENIFSKGSPYHNAREGFSLFYPESWQVNDTGFMGSAVIFIGSDEETDFKPSLNIFVNPSDGLNLGQHVNRTKEGLDKEIKEVRYKLKKFTGEGPIKLGKLDAYQLIYLFEQDGIHLKAKTLIYTDGPNTFMLTCTAGENDFSKVESKFDIIIKSFRLTKKA